MKYAHYYLHTKPAKVIGFLNLLVIGVLVFLISWGSLTVLESGKSSALSGADFQAGHIIDDGVFFDSSSMQAGDIQNFLNAKVPTCDTNGAQSKSYYYNSGTGRVDSDRPTPQDVWVTTTRALYGQRYNAYNQVSYASAPYTCLKDYSQNTPAMPGENALCSAFPGGARTAAQIIKDVSQVCGISPQVLLVLLQKEQSLVTDDWPWGNQYQKATGFNCPDTAPCDPQFAGFFYQVFYGARAFKKYARDANSYGYRAYRNNYIQYNPIASCGGSTVYIENQATAGLYVYTPYQPNQSALNNLYGTGDSCGAYGNRNFWRMFSDWFGSTYARPYYWRPTSQEAYLDAGRTKPLNIGALNPNQRYYFTLRVQNMGNKTWSNSGANPVLLGTNNPRNRSSGFCDTSTWLNCTRPAALKEASVAPGETGTFEFSMKAFGAYGSYREYFNLLSEGNTWMNDVGMYWPLTVRPPTPAWQPAGQEAYTDAAYTKPLNTDNLAPSARYYFRIRALNVGNTTWTNSGTNPIRLGTNNPSDRSSGFCDTSTWLNCTRPAALKEASVAPGETGTFEFSMKAFGAYGSYREYFNLLSEGNTWMNDVGMYWPLTVRPPTPAWQPVEQQVYTNNSKTTAFNISNTNNGTRFYAVIKARNSGNTTWTNSGTNPIRLGTNNPSDRSSGFCDTSTWLNCTRPAALKEASVAPGETGTFEFWMKAPYAFNNTAFKEYFRPLAEGSAWMNDVGMYLPGVMQSAEYSWQYGSQSSFTNTSRTNPVDLQAGVSPNTTYYLRLTAKNIGGKTWTRNQVNLGTNNPQNRTSSMCDNSWLVCSRAATLKEATVIPGGTGTFEFSIKTPNTPGTYNEYFRPVMDGVAWMEDVGLYWAVKVQ